MALDQAQGYGSGGGWRTMSAIIAADGSATHATPSLLARPHTAIRDLADAVHSLCLLHGRHPGLIDHASRHTAGDDARAWLDHVAAAFIVERTYITRLTAAAGPTPSTPGQAASEAAIAAQRHALDMLAQSDRTGCAIGAAIALVLDWATIRDTLDNAADRFSVTPAARDLPDKEQTARLVRAICATPTAERAMAFGAQQLLAQHRGLWDLIEARASARARQ